ncbi:MAG: hypothetical protein AAGG69_03755 [Pseudomonadota bacterium]
MATQLSTAVNSKTVSSFSRPDRSRVLNKLRRELQALSGENERFTDELTQLQAKQGKIASSRLSLGHGDFDRYVGGGLPCHGLTELNVEAARDAGCLSGFVAAVLARQSALNDERQTAPILWIAQQHVVAEAGRPYGHGLSCLGLDYGRLRFVTVDRLQDALWVCEEAASTKGLCGVVLDLRAIRNGPGLRETRRLHMRAINACTPLFFLTQCKNLDSSAAPVRLKITPIPSQEQILFAGTSFEERFPGSIGPPGFCVTVVKNKSGPAGNSFKMHWNSHERVFFKATDRNSDARSVNGRSDTSKLSGAHYFHSYALSGNRQNHAPASRRKVAGQ